MHTRSLVLILAVTAALFVAPAVAAPAARSFDLVTFTPPDGFTVNAAQADRVVISRVGSKSYCVIAIFSGADASADLDASFAAAWADLVDHAVDPVAMPANQHGTIAGADAAIGAVNTTTGGKPVLAMLTTIDAGAKVVSILVLTPNETDLGVYTPSITALLGSLTVRRVDAAAPASPPAAPPPGDGTLPAPARPLTVADLAGEWNHDDRALTRYVTASTGSYAGFDSISTQEQWVVDAKKSTIASVFHGVQAGNSGVRAIDEKHTFKVTLTADGELTLKPTERGGGAISHYLVRGWQVTPDGTLLVINGPWYDDGIPDDVRQDPHKGVNLNETWVRKAKKTK